MKRILSISFLLISLCLLFNSCRKKPVYSNTPEITINPIEHYVLFSTNRGVMVDSLILSIDFKDGDGDLGVDQEDLNISPWADTCNIVVDVYQKIGSTYTLLNLSPSYNGNFPLLSPKNISGPLDGILNYTIVIAHSPFLTTNAVLRFDIRILDRALHSSNTVSTPDITVNTP